ncbi:MAG TPA: transglutaminase domain-containing protein [Puia sp.]|jgi:hypothetical protein
MKFASPFLSGILVVFLPAVLSAQPGRPDMKFGEVSSQIFAPAVYGLDSNANAVVLFDRGEVVFDEASRDNHGFDIVFEKHARIRLLHKNAFGLASMVLSTSNRKNANAATIENFKGATYNLEDGKVVVTKLDKSNIFKEQNGDLTLEKIAFPNVKEGSVIEYTFRIAFPGFSYIPEWTFQGEYPVLWSEYDITFPTLFDYVTEKQGYQKFALDTVFVSNATIPVTFPGIGFGPPYRGTWSGEVVRHIWAMQNVPVLEKREPFTTTLRNHISKIEFQLSSIRVSGYNRSFLSTWDELTDQLMKDEHFGIPLTDRNHWMNDELKKITGDDKTSLQSVRNVYTYVRDHFDCSNAEGIRISQPFKTTWDDKKGNVADINLLLTALYQHQGLEASPVILSSRAHGFALPSYPLIKDYNYVITRVRVDGQYYLLDASKNYIGFNQLPELCYNGVARAIDASHDPILLSPDSLTERRTTTVNLSLDSAGLAGKLVHEAGRFESMELHNRLKKTKPEDFFEALRKTMAGYKTITESSFDTLTLKDQDLPVVWHYTMKYRFVNRTITFTPIMYDRQINPFTSADRHYPVEMPFGGDYTYNLNMAIPTGYTVEQLPKSQRVIMDDSTCIFEYRAESDGKNIRLSSMVRIKRTWFPVEGYEGLRNFFSLVANKEKEQIIFKKLH